MLLLVFPQRFRCSDFPRSAGDNSVSLCKDGRERRGEASEVLRAEQPGSKRRLPARSDCQSRDAATLGDRRDTSSPDLDWEESLHRECQATLVASGSKHMSQLTEMTHFVERER